MTLTDMHVPCMSQPITFSWLFPGLDFAGLSPVDVMG